MNEQPQTIKSHPAHPTHPNQLALLSLLLILENLLDPSDPEGLTPQAVVGVDVGWLPGKYCEQRDTVLIGEAVLIPLKHVNSLADCFCCGVER